MTTTPRPYDVLRWVVIVLLAMVSAALVLAPFGLAVAVFSLATAIVPRAAMVLSPLLYILGVVGFAWLYHVIVRRMGR